MSFGDSYILSKNWFGDTDLPDPLFDSYDIYSSVLLLEFLLVGTILPVGITLPVSAVLVSTVVTLSVGVMLSLCLY